ncbi:gamma carbonic anhydrase family protein [bacterium (Candidatus Blackallbacteria) CG17_big_fil_post_rev_8_21_14_2_50_48_46]|uniref:Gamma carbonic anhydrase family protein n=1 Tax=bacterium (Candidatus Blackallbacteria) CG17_big_fil_post_rev_8_21_14_2_50_48_46 TaxID=2014261 RepID=A0A2M7G9X7_9BACT|nr:MAG: gamma carbonic anhydrase family protein [bacterium (Candidatus Blackallbacteria) CG18_big_fil_WC_8_21_14_2_50_49_26]PIW18951.1 MAG: gamma carbonic anhydrase family protein [bacterium (Candidatus Blackallbacteria) CG17_big_fil_post_rev_8_21_14_2_50_48_46]PIW44681.1 MAG: gamma carbonic anhydrase family protein [bacterium (Candidatus Blackallbacteria) CG13_big_fil_rev_8_21_14_2_50_49_14]
MQFFLEDRFEFEPSAFIAPSALVLGAVRLGRNSSVWFQSVLRGDCDRIEIGADSNIQDGCILHTMEDYPVIIGERVSFGHCVMAHGCTIGNDVLVGIRATILNGAQIGENCVIAAGALVPENRVIPPHSLVMGSPARVVRAVDERLVQMIRETAEHYVFYSRAYARILPPWKPLEKCL